MLGFVLVRVIEFLKHRKLVHDEVNELEREFAASSASAAVGLLKDMQ